jgi:hypothetical protein
MARRPAFLSDRLPTSVPGAVRFELQIHDLVRTKPNRCGTILGFSVSIVWRPEGEYLDRKKIDFITVRNWRILRREDGRLRVIPPHNHPVAQTTTTRIRKMFERSPHADLIGQAWVSGAYEAWQRDRQVVEGPPILGNIAVGFDVSGLQCDDGSDDIEIEDDE